MNDPIQRLSIYERILCLPDDGYDWKRSHRQTQERTDESEHWPLRALQYASARPLVARLERETR